MLLIQFRSTAHGRVPPQMAPTGQVICPGSDAQAHIPRVTGEHLVVQACS